MITCEVKQFVRVTDRMQKQFTNGIVKYVADASSLGIRPGLVEPKIKIMNPKTGNFIIAELDDVETNSDREVMKWVYKASAESITKHPLTANGRYIVLNT